MQKESTALILEGGVDDIRTAFCVLEEAGYKKLQVFNNLGKAMVHLEAVANGEKPCPDLLVLDLGLGYDSGFEVLRFFKLHPQLSSTCSVVVWTVLGDVHQELCRLLGAKHVVSKEDGEPALLKAVMDGAKLARNTASSA